MAEETFYRCDNCGIEVIQDNAMFETTTEDFQAGFQFESKITSYETVLCSKCYNTYQAKRKRSSYGEPDIDISAGQN